MADQSTIEERIRRTQILLDSYLDYLPAAYRPSLQTTPGPVASRTSRCDYCAGRGTLPNKRLCPICDGDGRRPRRPGEPLTDEYTDEEVTTDETSIVRSMTPYELDAALARVERLLAEREGRYDDEPWVRKKERMRRHGDYGALERALLVLRHRHPLQYIHVWNALVLGWQLPNPDAERHVKDGVARLANDLPDPIRVPKWLLPEDLALKRSLAHGRTPLHQLKRRERDAQIRQLHSEGRSTTWLAREYQLSRRMIQMIIRSG